MKAAQDTGPSRHVSSLITQLLVFNHKLSPSKEAGQERNTVSKKEEEVISSLAELETSPSSIRALANSPSARKHSPAGVLLNVQKEATSSGPRILSSDCLKPTTDTKDSLTAKGITEVPAIPLAIEAVAEELLRLPRDIFPPAPVQENGKRQKTGKESKAKKVAVNPQSDKQLRELEVEREAARRMNYSEMINGKNVKCSDSNNYRRKQQQASVTPSPLPSVQKLHHNMSVCSCFNGWEKCSYAMSLITAAPVPVSSSISKLGLPIQKPGIPLQKAGLPMKKVGLPMQKAGLPIQKAEKLLKTGFHRGSSVPLDINPYARSI